MALISVQRVESGGYGREGRHGNIGSKEAVGGSIIRVSASPRVTI